METFSSFLVAIESRYGSNPYHNSMHAADVLITMHLFLSETDVASQLPKVVLLAAFVGAICHDFNHPGTSNAHEINRMSPLAITYSDSSPLERHHLASTFGLLNIARYNIFAGLSFEDFRKARALIIDLVLHTGAVPAPVSPLYRP